LLAIYVENLLSHSTFATHSLDLKPAEAGFAVFRRARLEERVEERFERRVEERVEERHLGRYLRTDTSALSVARANETICVILVLMVLRFGYVYHPKTAYL
jgi:hypothetical protein